MFKFFGGVPCYYTAATRGSDVPLWVGMTSEDSNCRVFGVLLKKGSTQLGNNHPKLATEDYRLGALSKPVLGGTIY